MENKQEDSFLQMHLDYDGGNILQETVRWSRFLAIVGFIGLGIILVGCALASSTFFTLFSTLAPGGQLLGGALVVVLLLALLAAWGTAVFMLFRFSALTRRGITQQDQVVFAEAMKCLKIYFIISGVLGVLSLLGNISSFVKLFIP